MRSAQVSGPVRSVSQVSHLVQIRAGEVRSVRSNQVSSIKLRQFDQVRSVQSLLTVRSISSVGLGMVSSVCSGKFREGIVRSVRSF